MNLFWFLIFAGGLLGALGDIGIAQWGKTYSTMWWVVSAVGYLAFMTSLGLAVRFGLNRGYPLTIALLMLLLVNVVLVAIWDVTVSGTSITFYQFVGILLAIAAVFCFELGK